MTRAESRALTRSRLLDAAATTFARKGYAAASVEEIAESAGYSVGAVYSNFSGKDHLLSELIADRGVDRVESVAELMKAARDQPGGALAAAGKLLVDVADRDIDAATLQTEFWLHAVRHPEAMPVLAESTNRTVAALRDVLAEVLTAHGIDDTVTPDTFAVVVLALFQGLVRQRRTDPARVSDELFGQVLSWLLAGMPKAGDARSD